MINIKKLESDSKGRILQHVREDEVDRYIINVKDAMDVVIDLLDIISEQQEEIKQRDVRIEFMKKM